LIRAKRLRFTNNGINIQEDPLPNHGPAVNMIHKYQERGLILNTQGIQTPLVPIHVRICQATLFSHDHDVCEVCSMDSRGCKNVKDDIQGLLDRGELLVTKKEQQGTSRHPFGDLRARTLAVRI